MQKKIIALAIAAAFAAPVAMAAESVSVYGSIDGGLKSVTTGGVTSNTFGSGTYISNRWGIKGTEDLGDGMNAHFTMEGDFNTGTGNGKPDTGTTNELFSRGSSVGITGNFGTVDLGRQYAVAFKTIATYEPFAFKFPSITYTTAAAITPTGRYDNDVSYTGKFGDITVMAEHTIPATGDDSTSTSTGGVGYASGPVNVGGAYSKTKVNGTLSDTTYYTAGAGFNFGDGKVSVGTAKNTIAGTSIDSINTYTWIGGNFNVTSKVEAIAGYYRNVINAVNSSVDTTSSRLMVAGVYSLSKKTKMYVEADKQTVDASGTSTDSNGYSLGLSTTF